MAAVGDLVRWKTALGWFGHPSVARDVTGSGAAGHELGQPLPPGIRIDLGQLHIGIGDAHQVIEERQVLRVCIANLGIDLRSGGMRVKTLDAGGRAQQPRYDVEGDLAGVRFTKGGEHASRTICAATPMARAAANSPQQASASGRNIIIVWCKPQWCTIFRTDLT